MKQIFFTSVFNLLCLAFSTYNRLWREAESTITDLLTQEMPEEKPKPEKVGIAFIIMNTSGNIMISISMAG